MKPSALFACLFLALVAAGHLLRLVFRVPLTIGTMDVPLWPSAVAVLGAGGLCLWLWRQEQQPAS
jgi:hypothetical protein